MEVGPTEKVDAQRPNSIWLSPDTFCVRNFESGSSGSSDQEREEMTYARSAMRFLESVIERHVVVICASIRVEYRGRASSVADTSDRIVITKPDGTLIIHEDTKHRPLNWQPPGTSFHLSVRDGHTVTLEAFRKKDSERVTIWFERISYIAASRITPGKFRFSGSESEMVDLVIRKPELIEEGFVPKKREFKIRYGNVDLIGEDKEGNILVLEFKRRQAQLSSASQLDRYVQYLIENQQIQRLTKPDRESGKGKIRGGIVAPTITAEALAFLKRRGYEFFRLEPKIHSLVSRLPTGET